MTPTPAFTAPGQSPGTLHCTRRHSLCDSVFKALSVANMVRCVPRYGPGDKHCAAAREGALGWGLAQASGDNGGGLARCVLRITWAWSDLDLVVAFIENSGRPRVPLLKHHSSGGLA